MSHQASPYRTAAALETEPNPITMAWDRYRSATRAYAFILGASLLGFVVQLLAFRDQLLPISLVSAGMLAVSWKRARRCRCPVCENPILGGPYQESRLGPLLAVFPLSCTYCDVAAPVEERPRKLRALSIAFGVLVLVGAGVLLWRYDSSGDRFTVRGLVFDPRERKSEVIVRTSERETKWDDGALSGSVFLRISTGRITGFTYVHDRVVIR